MHFSLDVLRARKGDCLMLHYGDKKDRHVVLIDGGPSDVYKPQLKDRLKTVRDAWDIDATEPLPVEIVMVSHIDDDHIRGIVELTDELRGKKPDIKLLVGTIWHNYFDDLFGDKVEKKTPRSAAASVLASVKQGTRVRDNAEALGWKPNKKFKKKLILATKETKPVTFHGDLQLTVAGPMLAELEELHELHDDWLRAQDAKKKETAEAALAAFVDDSVPNLSSIVVVAELGKKSMLLTGDARGDKILKGLELVGFLPAGGARPVNILKVPHHGSERNMEPVFFERLPADHYVFSGNGEHGNPARATFEMLLEARGPGAKYEIHMTYPVEEIDKARKKFWDQKHKGTAWSPQKQSLVAFFKANPKMKAKLRFVKDKTPHMIDLLDPVCLD